MIVLCEVTIRMVLREVTLEKSVCQTYIHVYNFLLICTNILQKIIMVLWEVTPLMVLYRMPYLYRSFSPQKRPIISG